MLVSFRLLSLIGHICVIGVWFGEDQSTKHHKDTCFKEIELRLSYLINYFTVDSEHN